MPWNKVGRYRCYSESNGDAKETRLAMQRNGLELAQVQYCVKVVGVKDGDAQIGLKHYDAPDDDVATTPRAHSTPISIATPSSTLPALMAGSTGTTTPSMPCYWPTAVVQTGGAQSQMWVEFDLFVGGQTA